MPFFNMKKDFSIVIRFDTNGGWYFSVSSKLSGILINGSMLSALVVLIITLNYFGVILTFLARGCFNWPVMLLQPLRK